MEEKVQDNQQCSEKEIKYYHDKLRIAQEQNDEVTEQRMYMKLGVHYQNIHQYETSMEYHHKALKLAQELGSQNEERMSLTDIGACLGEIGQSKEAIEYDFKALKLTQELNDKVNEQFMYRNLGFRYESIRQYEKAMEYHHKALEFAQELGSQNEERTSLTDISACLGEIGQSKEAIEYEFKALKLAQELNDKVHEQGACRNLGLHYQEIRQYETSIEFFHKALAIAQQLGLKREEQKVCHSLESVYKEHGQLETSLEYFEKAAKIAQELKNDPVNKGPNPICRFFRKIWSSIRGKNAEERNLKSERQLSDEATYERCEPSTSGRLVQERIRPSGTIVEGGEPSTSTALVKGAECNNPPTIKQKEFCPSTIEWRNVNQQFDVLLITVNDEEFKAATTILSSPQRTDTGKRLGPFYFGKIGKNIVALVRSAPGATGKAAVQATCQDAIEELSPKVIVLLGVCFGMSKDEQSLGDLLVATQTAFYSQGRINKDGTVFPRSSQPECEARLQRAFQDGKVTWTAPGDGKIKPKVHFGLVLSGPQLIDNEERKEEIRKAFPGAIGGEMEAEGVYSLCDRHKIPWILCKSICDWADGSKNDTWQPYAAAVSASFVEHVLEQTYLPGMREENGEQGDGSSTSASTAKKPNRDLRLDSPDGPTSVKSGRQRSEEITFEGSESSASAALVQGSSTCNAKEDACTSSTIPPAPKVDVLELKDIKETRVDWPDFNRRKTDVLLLTANDIEFCATLKILPDPKITDSQQSLGLVYFDEINHNRVAVLKSDMGSTGAAGIQTTLLDAIELLKPGVIVCLGVAFGMNQDKVQLGDVLVATKMALYGKLKVDTEGEILRRGTEFECNARLFRLFDLGKYGWNGPSNDGSAPKVHLGLVLSGPVLINNKDFKEKLRRFYPEALGGEMEGEGLYSICRRSEIPWIVCKGVSDWADGTKNKSWQPYAAAAAASYVEHILKKCKVPAQKPGMRGENGEQRDGGSTSASTAQKPNSDLGLDRPDGSTSVNSENQDKQRPADRLQPQEIVLIAERIPIKWQELAILTKLFELHEIDDIARSSRDENESRKAFNMLRKYIERGGTRQKLAAALGELRLSSLAQDVLSGYFISNQ